MPTRKAAKNEETLPEGSSPARSLVLDLVQLRKLLHVTARAYVNRLESEVDELTAWASERAKDRETSKAGFRHLRDMLALIRTLDLKPAKGRRKDLKKIDSTIAELRSVMKEATPR